ncbi:hypothetical protein K438DRAFT_1762171 [Mycena galopus ATCC 62051]|nr:hypothetical protein K438DRAFT_1762171 [Mycena galopus ATCC 62051]
MASAQYRCEPPCFPDPGQPPQPGVLQKLYLVTGRTASVKAGVYALWNRAGSLSQGVGSGVQVQKYGPHEREAMRAAWHSGCGHSDYDHPADPSLSRGPLQPTPPSSPAVKLWSPSPPPKIAPSGKPSGKQKIKLFPDTTPYASPTSGWVISISSRSPSPTLSPFTLGSVAPTGLKAYSVRLGNRGWVYSDIGDARDKFHLLQLRGQKVEVATKDGFACALAFAERPTPAADSAKGQRRREWAREEGRAWCQRQAAEPVQAAREAAGGARLAACVRCGLEGGAAADPDAEEEGDKGENNDGLTLKERAELAADPNANKEGRLEGGGPGERGEHGERA